MPFVRRKTLSIEAFVKFVPAEVKLVVVNGYGSSVDRAVFSAGARIRIPVRKLMHPEINPRAKMNAIFVLFIFVPARVTREFYRVAKRMRAFGVKARQVNGVS